MHMAYTKNKVDDITVFEVPRFNDNRGSFTELFNENKIDYGINFVQDNFSTSHKNVLRGLHLQKNNPQGKLVTCVCGSVLDIVVDVRPTSPTFSKIYKFELKENKQIYIPAGFAHGFLSLEDNSCVYYKCTAPYDPDSEITISPFDAALDIDWGINIKDCIVSEKDKNGISIKDLL